MNFKLAVACAAMAFVLTPPAAEAQSVSDVEGARAKERQGRHLTRQDREQLRRYGGNDDYGPRYSYRRYGYGGYYGDAYGYEPSYRSYYTYPD